MTTARGAPKPRASLPREVILLGWVSFFADVSSEMAYPLLPLFLVGVLGASASSLGWVEGLAMAVVALLTAWVGWQSDRVRRRVRYVRWGYGLPIVGKTILAAAVSWPMVMLGRAIDRTGKGIRSSPRDALIADTTAADMRGRAFGFHRAMDTAGALLGVLIAALLLWWLADSPSPEAAAAGAVRDDGRAFRIVFVISAALSVIALALTFLVREPPREAPTAVAPASASSPAPSAKVGVLGLPRRYWIVVGLLLVFSFANSSDTFLLLRAADLGLEPWAVVVAYAVYNLAYMLGAYPAGVLSDRLGRWRLIAAGWGLYAVVYVGFALATPTTLWPLLAAYGGYMALTDGVGKALITDHAPAAQRGLAIGIFYMATGLTTLASSVVAGVLWDRVGPAAPFWCGAIAAATALALLPFALRGLRAT